MIEQLEKRLEPHKLFVMGQVSEGKQTRFLVGCQAGFWPIFEKSFEFKDHKNDPLDRWSKRVLGEIEKDIGASVAFPSDGPPYAPFVKWALQSGRFWESPLGMLVHDKCGLMISIRAALLVTHEITEVAHKPSPCIACEEKPCLSSCPVGAFSANANYDVRACKLYLSTANGERCFDQGCQSRAACPISQEFSRDVKQNDFHMQAFMNEKTATSS